MPAPCRAWLRKIQDQTSKRDSLVLQGTELTAAWSAFVDRKNGALTVALVDSEGRTSYSASARTPPPNGSYK